MALNVPVHENAKLQTLVERVEAHDTLRTYWQCSNVIAINRMGINDHGPIHIKIVTNMALKMFRILTEQGLTPSIVADHGLTNEDAECVVVLASCLHDIGHVVHRHNHEEFSVSLAPPLIRELIDGLYAGRERAIITSETLHAIYAHRTDVDPLTVEAGVLKVADALDMEQGRARIPFEKGSPTIHAVSAMAIEKVHVHPGENKPVCIEIRMSNSAGIFQIDNLLKRKLQSSGLKDHYEIRVDIRGEEKKIVSHYEI